jgi:hypothetical protein
VLGAGPSGADGSYDVGIDSADDPGTSSVLCTPPEPSWTTTFNPRDEAVDHLNPVADSDFVFTERTVCFRRASSWVHEVCWVTDGPAAPCVQVTYHDRHRWPYFRCRYPGTTYADYRAFRAAGSLGHHARVWYYRRPYVPMPPAG